MNEKKMQAEKALRQLIEAGLVEKIREVTPSGVIIGISGCVLGVISQD